MKEERVDLRIPHPEDFETARQQAQLIFKLNHTMPMTEEYNISAMKEFKPLSEAELVAIDKVREIFNSKNMIPCTSCRYCTAGCPKQILIPDLFACLNAKKVFNNWNTDYYYNNVYTTRNSRI